MAWQKTVQTRWSALAQREQLALTLAALVVGLALFWGVLVAPALRTLKAVQTQRAALAAQLERMQALQARATQLQAKPALLPKDALQTLQAVATALGKNASVQVLGEQATVTLKQVSAPDLAPWLAPQSTLGLSPLEAHLQRDAGSTTALWSGTLVFQLPPAAR
jgi:general secretion pathway protein M